MVGDGGTVVSVNKPRLSRSKQTEMLFSHSQEDPFKVKTSGFCSVPQEMHTDPFHSEDPFKTDPFKGADSPLPLLSLSPFPLLLFQRPLQSLISPRYPSVLSSDSPA